MTQRSSGGKVQSFRMDTTSPDSSSGVNIQREAMAKPCPLMHGGAHAFGGGDHQPSLKAYGCFGGSSAKGPFLAAGPLRVDDGVVVEEIGGSGRCASTSKISGTGKNQTFTLRQLARAKR